MLIEERKNLVIEEIGSSQGVFLPIDLGKSYVRIGVDSRLLVDLANALDVADVIGVLAE